MTGDDRETVEETIQSCRSRGNGTGDSLFIWIADAMERLLERVETLENGRQAND